MKTQKLFVIILIFLGINSIFLANSQTFKLSEVRNYPFPTSLTAAATGNRVAWAFDESGKRNIYVAEAPDFKARKLTAFDKDDGQEISSLALSDDGKWVVYVRGGDHGSNWNSGGEINVNADPFPPKVGIHVLSYDGKQHFEIGEGDQPVISPKGDRIAYLKKGQVWISRIDSANAGKQVFNARGTMSDLRWSPDGRLLAFVSNRQDHSFIGIYTDANSPIRWMAPSFTRDRSPRWSPDGKSLAFVRMAGLGGAPDSIIARKHQPWAIWTAEVNSGKATLLWKSPQTPAGSPPGTHGSTNLHWAANNRIVFLAAHSGWQHLYSMAATGGTPLALTSGKFMSEHIILSSDKKWLYFSTNAGPDAKDIDRRHIARVPVDQAKLEVLSPGSNMEWTPVVTGDNKYLTFITAIGQQPPLPAAVSLSNLSKLKDQQQLMAVDHIPSAFPTKKLVTPKQVIFEAPDGMKIHGQIFAGQGKASKKPAIVYVHGGPSRQMLLGWNYSEYYANAYAMNQYLASLGFTVLSVNYRLGIGYGYDFQSVTDGGTKGASEYQDIKAAAEWLAKQGDVDATRIGIYGGSYGGYMTNMALARDSKLFAAGVSIHSLGDRTIGDTNDLLMPDRYEKAPDAKQAAEVAWASSPVADMATWTSPVLLIHGDDDRNVEFSQSTDLNKRLEQRGIPVETMVIVDDTHHWMKYDNQMKVNEATAAFFVKYLKP